MGGIGTVSARSPQASGSTVTESARGRAWSRRWAIAIQYFGLHSPIYVWEIANKRGGIG